MRPSCDLFCRVVDNLGDAAVCWRLSRQLATEFGWKMRLWIDDPSPLDSLAPDHGSLPVEVRPWQDELPDVAPADVVIEAFACELPGRYVARMAARPKPPLWINLEYLSAEDWVPGCHGLPSPHPTLPLTKHFFFPGFVPGTGGLIRERNADFGRATHHGIGSALAVSMFCYDNPALPSLLTVWANGDEPIVCRVADGLPRRQAVAWLGEPFEPGATLRRGALELAALPFVPQPAYDHLLGACDLDFVRGEDSFVRAQWAQRPFVWQAYPQAEGAHWAKIDAFLARYCRALPQDRRAATADFFRAWNGRGDVAAAWPAFRAALPGLAEHAAAWSDEIASAGNLAENLVRFCRERL
jgi:uncharacterized repeat protein (TIGR03837 family)